MSRRLLAFLLLLSALPAAAGGLEFRSIAADRTVMYDAPSLQGRKRFLASQHYPVEVVVAIESFVKVRDVAGDLVWVEKKNLSDRRMVLVNTPLAEVRQAPDEKSALLFQAERGVVLELVEYAGNGWLKVRHADGAQGFVRVSQVWGA